MDIRKQPTGLQAGLLDFDASPSPAADAVHHHRPQQMYAATPAPQMYAATPAVANALVLEQQPRTLGGQAQPAVAPAHLLVAAASEGPGVVRAQDLKKQVTVQAWEDGKLNPEWLRERQVVVEVQHEIEDEHGSHGAVETGSLSQEDIMAAERGDGFQLALESTSVRKKRLQCLNPDKYVPDAIKAAPGPGFSGMSNFKFTSDLVGFQMEDDPRLELNPDVNLHGEVADGAHSRQSAHLKSVHKNIQLKVTNLPHEVSEQILQGVQAHDADMDQAYEEAGFADACLDPDALLAPGEHVVSAVRVTEFFGFPQPDGAPEEAVHVEGQCMMVLTETKDVSSAAAKGTQCVPTSVPTNGSSAKRIFFMYTGNIVRRLVANDNYNDSDVGPCCLLPCCKGFVGDSTRSYEMERTQSADFAIVHVPDQLVEVSNRCVYNLQLHKEQISKGHTESKSCMKILKELWDALMSMGEKILCILCCPLWCPALVIAIPIMIGAVLAAIPFLFFVWCILMVLHLCTKCCTGCIEALCHKRPMAYSFSVDYENDGNKPPRTEQFLGKYAGLDWKITSKTKGIQSVLLRWLDPATGELRETIAIVDSAVERTSVAQFVSLANYSRCRQMHETKLDPKPSGYLNLLDEILYATDNEDDGDDWSLKMNGKSTGKKRGSKKIRGMNPCRLVPRIPCILACCCPCFLPIFLLQLCCKPKKGR